MWKTHMCTITVHGQCADCSPGQHRQTAALCRSAEGNTSLTNGHTPLVRLNPGIVRLLHERTYVHAAVGPVFWLRRKQISLCGVRTCVSVSAPTLVPAPWCFVTWPPPWVLTAGPLNTSGYSLSLLCRRDVFCFQTIQVQFIYLFTFIVMFVSWCEGTLESLILRIITKTSGREKTGVDKYQCYYNICL